MTTYLSWVKGKSELAHALANGSCGGTYADGAIVLCTSISTMSSLMWAKEKRTDRKRFIEIVARFSRPDFDTTTVSTILLSQSPDHDLLIQRLAVSDIALRYTGNDDKSESEIIKLCSASISSDDCKKLARKYSYACLLYEHIRCGFIHTYRTTDSAASDDALRGIFNQDTSRITYVNYLAAEQRRKIYFPLEWISKLAQNIATGLDSECARLNKVLGESLDLAVPSTWWIEGA